MLYRMRGQGDYARTRFGRTGEAGQAVTEYIVVVVFCLLVILSGIAAFLGQVGSFYNQIMTMVCLPVP